MKILFVALTSPFPPTNGHRLKVWALLQALAQDGHSITLLILAVSSEETENFGPLRDLCQHVEAIPALLHSGALGGHYLGRLITLFSARPYGASRFRCPLLKERIMEVLGSGDFDVILCDGEYNMQNLPDSLPVPVVLNKDDVGYLLVERYSKLQRNPAKKLYGWLEARKIRRFEREAVSQATVMACSGFDRNLLHALCPEARIMIVPNVVDTEKYAPVGKEKPSTVLYQGGMDWYPNRDAAEFFISSVLPHLRRLSPGVKFVAAGRDPGGTVGKQFARFSDVRFTGTVPDMRDEIAKAVVCVVPLRIGSGTRLKILEAAAMAKPLVSTRLGVEGLDFEDGKEILLADDPVAFARAVANLLADPGHRRALGLAARRRVEAQYSMRALRESLRETLEILPSGRDRSTQEVEIRNYS
jgi:glycosyltransferase involved in cell wall biosynthesis